MTVFEMFNDHAFGQLIPDDAEFDTSKLNVFLQDPTADFPASRLRPVPEDDGSKPLAAAFLLYGLAIPIFSERAKNELLPVLQGFGTLHPVPTSKGQFFAFKIASVVDALDYSYSDIEYALTPRTKKKAPRAIRRYALHLEKLQHVPIFRLPEFALTNTYVSDNFRDVYLKARLNGLAFNSVFPLPSQESVKNYFLNSRDKKTKGR